MWYCIPTQSGRKPLSWGGEGIPIDTTMEQDLVSALRRQSVAIGSGKGGVGKSTTALNIGLVLARKELRVGLLDLDPLSNLSVILDLPAEQLQQLHREISPGITLEQVTLPYAGSLDLVFPHPTGTGKIALFHHFAAALVAQYDVLVCDLPAGIAAEENLGFLPYMGALLLVTNAEPPAHVSAGGYLRSVLDTRPDMPVMIWHNRYKPAGDNGFDPRALIANYNRYVDEDLHITPGERKSIRDIAFVPDDPALNLLKTELDSTVTLLSKLRELTALIHDQYVRQHLGTVEGSTRTGDLISWFVVRNREIGDLPTYLERLDQFLESLPGVREQLRVLLKSLSTPSSGMRMLSPKQAEQVHAAITVLSGDELYKDLIHALALLDAAVTQAVDAERMFMDSPATNYQQQLYQVVPKLLQLLAQRPKLTPFMRTTAATLLFTFAAYIELEDPETQELLKKLVPRKYSSRGELRRDRHAQIARLIRRDESYHTLFFQVLRTIFPGLTRRISGVAKQYGLVPLLLRDEAGAVNRSAYVTLSTHLLHDVVNSGLGVSISANYNATSKAIRSGVETLMQDRAWVSAPRQQQDSA